MQVKPSTTRIVAAVICAIGLATVGGYAQEGEDQPLADTALDTSMTDECGGRSPKPTVPCEDDVARMLNALPATAPATPARPRKVLVLGVSRGFQHSSIPLAARTIEEMGKKGRARANTSKPRMSNCRSNSRLRLSFCQGALASRSRNSFCHSSVLLTTIS